jgi:hypothetical protein
LKPPILVGTQIVLMLSGVTIALGVFFFLILPLSGILRSNTAAGCLEGTSWSTVSNGTK